MLNSYEIHPVVENVVPFSNLLKEYVAFLDSMGQDINGLHSPQSQQSTQKGTKIGMTNAQRKEAISKITANAYQEPEYHLSPIKFMKMYSRELEWLDSLQSDAAWDEISTQLLHKADKCLISYDPNSPDFNAIEDAISNYDHYLAELKWDFAPWAYTADHLQFRWELKNDFDDSHTRVWDKTRL